MIRLLDEDLEVASRVPYSAALLCSVDEETSIVVEYYIMCKCCEDMQMAVNDRSISFVRWSYAIAFIASFVEQQRIVKATSVEY